MSITKSKNGNETVPTLFSDFFRTDPFFKPGWLDRELEKSLPAVNIRENDTSFTIELAAPGFTKKDFQVHVAHDVLTISAEKKNEKKEEEDRYTRREYAFESFSRSFSLPQNAVSDGLKAKYEDGILRLEVPKIPEAKSKSRKEVPVT